MVLLAFLSSCSNGQTPPIPTTHVVAGHGETMQEAHHHAVRKAQAHCDEALPRVIERMDHAKEPTFASQPAPDIPPADEVTDLAATTHEGESPAVRLGFQCFPEP